MKISEQQLILLLDVLKAAAEGTLEALLESGEVVTREQLKKLYDQIDVQQNEIIDTKLYPQHSKDAYITLCVELHEALEVYVPTFVESDFGKHAGKMLYPRVAAQREEKDDL